MFITPEDVRTFWIFTFWALSLVICIVLLLFPHFRKRSNPLAWIAGANVGAAILFFWQFPVAAAREANFKSADPGYAEAAVPFDGTSLYFSNPAKIRGAAYDCFGSYSASSCEIPVTHLLRSEQVTFVEMDLGDRLVRYSISVHDPRCLDWDADHSANFRDDPFVLQDRWVSPGLAACVVEDEIDAITATHDISATRGSMGWPSKEDYYSVHLRNRSTGQLLDQFDGWYGVEPFLGYSLPDPHPRRPLATLAGLLMIPTTNTAYDPSYDDKLIAQHGVDEELLRAAMRAPYQMLKAEALWMACRDEIAQSLSDETLSTLSRASTSVFSSEWTYPQDCHDWMR